jgi:hypothetical protein
VRCTSALRALAVTCSDAQTRQARAGATVFQAATRVSVRVRPANPPAIVAPEIVFEASITIYTIVKGFRPSPILDDTRYAGTVRRRD